MMRREVSADLDVYVGASTTLEFQVAVAPLPGAEVTENLSFTLDGNEIEPTELIGAHGSRIHKFDAEPGRLLVKYRATILGEAEPVAHDELELSTYLRPSRYAEADKFFGFAATEFGAYTDPSVLVEKVPEWVNSRLKYVPGSSDPIDGAVDTLLAGRGVCRDYAHLVVALLRAVFVPARLVSVYAPGCFPMDFHAVAEAFVDGRWRAVDATGLAPRQTMVRIATGRDAADTAFMDNHGGSVNLNSTWVTAWVEGMLPTDSMHDLVSLH
jgi:transglutaminase-like putative cysteine protease